MKIRIIKYVNYVEYATVEVKNEDEVINMHENGLDENLSWHEGKDYGETTHEIMDDNEDVDLIWSNEGGNDES